MSPPHKVEEARQGGRRRLLPNVIDQIAEKEPRRVFLSKPRSSNPEDGWRDITYRTMADAIDRLAHHLVQELGPAPKGAFPTITYIGPNDGRYYLYAVAAIKAGYKVREDRA